MRQIIARLADGEVVGAQLLRHTQLGRLTLRETVEMYARHAGNHARQMQEVREQYKLVRSKMKGAVMESRLPIESWI